MRKAKKTRDRVLWMAPGFSLAKPQAAAAFRPRLPDVKKLDRTSLPPLSPELDNNVSVARLLELADVALGRKKRKRKSLPAA
jgi:hypothetical protein